MEDSQEKFEKGRAKTLSEIPDNIKDMFGQIGFTKSEYSDDIIPVLVVSPFDVPPKPVRDIYWFDLFSKGKRAKKLKTLAYLVYHYGSGESVENCEYSFIEQSDFEPYESGLAKGYGEIPKAIQDKLDGNVALSEEEQERVDGVREMKEDAKKEPQDRKRGTSIFKERHEMLPEKKEPPKGAKGPPKKKQRT